ncbi:23S rRNA (uracil-5-)-methyltransferase RumA [Tindallia magadiensis]|uniref:23S rRNA (Uracil-5-)-methyltransferase RumA n=1 Tax=Tindallia magadiensis TaxID=69895 RepID=A0A1I3B3U1_9FIRM|nr:23S rRNA (uracil(1939)-C(5))-methyltransferase RlmD [Tindallia magadiensis]SFH56870.1 23S rRNA (uracil-5-)-methyltransferase RumA [Tindallia magadiensis]
MDVKKGQEIELLIENTFYGGRAEGYMGDNHVLTDRGLPGQKLLVRVKKKRPGKLEATTVKRLEKSPEETEAPCIHAETCGGCSMQGTNYPYQLALKNQQVQALFQSKKIEVPHWLDPIKSPLESEYRNKMEFTFGNEYKDGPLTLGMHQRGRRFDIVDTYDCRLIDADFRKIRTATVDFFRNTKEKPYHKISREGSLRNLVLRKGHYTGEIMTHLITTSAIDESLIHQWKQEILDQQLKGINKSILWTKNDSFADAVKSDETILLEGSYEIKEKLQGLDFRITPFSFFQTNSTGANELYGILKQKLEKHDEEIFDLYCGLGTITQILAQNANHVTGIDIVDEAIQQAKESAKENGIENCRFIAGDVKDKLHQLTTKPDVLVLDPPRPGVNEEAMQDLLNMNPQKIIYVSCNPKTLVTNLQQAIESGYKVKEAQCIDLFPATPHMETVCLLTRK